jgi:hypothetical protein
MHDAASSTPEEGTRSVISLNHLHPLLLIWSALGGFFAAGGTCVPIVVKNGIVHPNRSNIMEREEKHNRIRAPKSLKYQGEGREA